MATKSPNYLNKMYSSLFILSLLLSVVLSLPYLCYEKSGVEEYSIFSLETLIILNKLLNIQIRPLGWLMKIEMMGSHLRDFI